MGSIFGRFSKVFLFCVLSVFSVGFISAGRASTQSLASQSTPTQPTPTSTASLCPEISDSVSRLFIAFFSRLPQPEELQQWLGVYATSDAGLQEIADTFARSEEFASRLGLLSNEAFVDFVYQTIQTEEPTVADRTFWVDSLAAGYSRGSMMLAFTESEMFVSRTNTAVPLAGYLNWYPQGARWFCGQGSAEFTVEPLRGSVFADTFFDTANAETEQPFLSRVQVADTTGQPGVVMFESSLPSGSRQYRWDGVFRGDGSYGSIVRVDASPQTRWVVIFYPRSIGETRLGWQLNS